MEPEQTTTDETISEPVSEPSEPISEPSEPTAETVDDSQMIELLQSINDMLSWSIAFQVVVMCLLLFVLFFVAMKAGKGQ